MGRWLVILSLAVVQWPDVALASSKSPDLPLWKKLLFAFTPIPRPAPRQHPVKAAVTARRPEPPDRVEAKERDLGVRAAATSSPAEPAALSPLYEPARPTGTGCIGGRRIISAFYSQGQRTASGQPFDAHAMTAAHRTLPFGTRLTVTNPRTGKSVIVLVNDRGPFISGVSLDLSLAAAEAIGLRGTGTVCIGE
jgi:rare lipoprotein A